MVVRYKSCQRAGLGRRPLSPPEQGPGTRTTSTGGFVKAYDNDNGQPLDKDYCNIVVHSNCSVVVRTNGESLLIFERKAMNVAVKGPGP